ncbi:unnamed protein product [Pieris macdunnoughi]|uniref:Peptidase M14 domain-containing protein n=1 Tax=Pieris macdunnoughi TaxID=345717 RepID=A0A821MU96_9NEOP|nr:unnamed protein product [Pieris macdunnoughi]
MARRLALFALLACLVSALHPPPRPADLSISESDDPFAFWDDYDESPEFVPVQASIPKNRPKVIIRSKIPKVNVTMKKSDKNKVIKTTIKIESHTNFIVTRRTPVNSKITRSPSKKVVSDQELWVDINASTPRSTSKKPNVRRTTTSRTTSTKRQTTKQPRRTTRSQHTTVLRQTPKRKYNLVSKSTKAPKKSPCPPKHSGYKSTALEDVKDKRPSTQNNSGIFTRIYKWIVGSKTSWFSGGWFQPDIEAPSRSTTPVPPSTSTGNWFQLFLDSEDNDNAHSTNGVNIKKSDKKVVRKNYKGYQLLRSYPDTQWKIRSLIDLQEEGEGSGLMWWTLPSLNGSTDLLVPPDLLVDVKDHLKSSNVDFEVIIWDLQKAIMYENPKLSKKQRLELVQLRGHPMTWRRYHRYADILRYLEYLQLSYSDIVELVPLGRSSEGLPLVVVKISLPTNETMTKASNTKEQKKKWKLRSYTKPAIWIDGGSHAREWIAPAVASWLIHNLVEGEKDSGIDYEVLKVADFYIMPVLNPDGYEHSHTHDRLWRKTRSRLSDSDDYGGWLPWNWGRTDCVGVDADRNWDYHWREKDSSQDPCSDNYAGPHPFSEPETRAVSEFLAEHRGQIKVYLSLHAYSQSWLLPSSHAYTSYSDDGVLMEMGKLATTALADMYGTKYKVGTAADIQQPASGMSHDWAKARAGIKFSYHVDLRDSYGPYGFLLPGSQIVSTAREIWQAIKAIVDNLSS